MSENTTSSITEILESLKSGRGKVTVAGFNRSARAYFCAKAFEALKRDIIVIAPHANEAEKFVSDLRFFLEPEQSLDSGNQEVHLLPNYEVLPLQGISPPVEVSARRIGTLYAMHAGNGPMLTVTSAGALTQRIIPRSELSDHAELVIAGEDADREILIRNLAEGGYFRTTLVEQRGDFCVRGDLIDLYPPRYEYPIRIEFFGDFIESIRFFDVGSQRSFADLSELIILPVTELIRSADHLNRSVQRLDALSSDVQTIQEMTYHLRAGNVVSGAESILPLFYENPETIADYVSKDALVVYLENDRIRASAEEERPQWEAAIAELGEYSPFFPWENVESELNKHQVLSFSTILIEGEDNPGTVHHIRCEENEDLKLLYNEHHHDWRHKRQMIDLLQDWITMRTEVVWVAHGPRRSEQVYEHLSEYGFPMRIEKPPLLGSGRHAATIRIFSGALSQGFRLPSEGLVVITDEEFLGPRRRARKSTRSKLDAYVSSFEDLKTGDMVVHAEHGIGRYEGLVQLVVDNIPNDFLLIHYRDADRLYLPVYNLKLIQKYVGVDGQVVRVDKMGGKTWSTVKSKVRKGVEKLARQLLETFAERNSRKGYAFSSGNGHMHEFEERFPYEETPDQLHAIEDVFNDMESSRPMDRLVCGDVGYGKTEVAIRAAYKCILDGKQVCFLVPTTVLAAQHYETFCRRFKDYPVNVDMLSRFRTLQEQKKTLEGLLKGTVDIIVGTHRVLSKDVSFKDLGLLIIDEEHRFGVAHKEKIKKFKKLVDVLTLTATPIPRTLQMGLLGIRDLSTIETPPQDRLAIKTYLAKYDERVIKGAIERELKRNGQVFFVHNRVQSIDATAGHLKRLVPGAGVGIAHGQLTERELEKVMLKFLQKEIDVLVCTAIIESGLDIPSANTIIINRADRFGLAQIYQLRGRVGRSTERAYAYLLITGENSISEEAKKRLKVLMDFTELGAGFKIAFHDLQIRGGGEILGPAQSGHIAAVGFEMYFELLEQTISEMKGEEYRKPLEPEINLRIPAFIPESYIPGIDQRLNLYKRVSEIENESSTEDMLDELSDRFGDPPQEVKNLMEIVRLKMMLRECWVKRLDVKGDTLVFSFDAEGEPPLEKVLQLVQNRKSGYRITPEGALFVRLHPKDTNLLERARKTLQELH